MSQAAATDAPPAHTAASTSIHIDKLTKAFSRGSQRTVAVNQASLEIEPGELFFLLGPSGCGKTTLLRMIAGFIEPTDGRILFNGTDVTHNPPEKRNTGMVFQSYALWPHMTVEQNVAFGLNVRKVEGAERDRRVMEALETVQMGQYASRKPNELSGGQQQRVALARALVIRPAVLLLDEPLSNLDAKLRIELRSQIRQVCKSSGITTVYVTHDQKEALSMADRMAVLKDGHVIQVGSPQELYRNPGSAFVASFLGETNFVDATIGSIDSGLATLTTPAGALQSDRLQHMKTLASGDTVTCSLRPEAGKLVAAGTPNSLRGKYLESIYLGELIQHTIELDGGAHVRIAELNPQPASTQHSSGESVGVAFNPEDVVLVPSAS